MLELDCSPSEHKNWQEEDVSKKKGNFEWKFLKISQKYCQASIDIYIYFIFCSLYYLKNFVYEVNFILGHSVRSCYLSEKIFSPKGI